MHTTRNFVEFAICLSNDGCADLETWKVYRVLPDVRASDLGCLRVIDESGEDYLYPASRFEPVALSEEGRSQLLATVKATAFFDEPADVKPATDFF